MSERRTISLSIRGFDVQPEEVVRLIGVEPNLLGKKGDQIRPGVTGVWKKNVVLYERPIIKYNSWDQAISSLIEEVGGVEKLQAMKGRIDPEFILFDLKLPVRSSDEQEDGAIGSDTMRAISSIGADLAFSFV